MYCNEIIAAGYLFLIAGIKYKTYDHEKINLTSAYQIAYLNRFGIALQNGVVLFEEVILGIANLWLLIVVVVAGWLGYRYYKRKHSKPILNNI